MRRRFGYRGVALMKTSCCLLLLLASPLGFAQGTPPPVNIVDPASFETKEACLADCKQVLADCRTQCENSRATARERHFDTPDLPVGACLADCEENLVLCEEDC